MKLVEVTRGLLASDETVKKAMQVVLQLDKEPVEVWDNAGFVVNRILIPMINEAVGLLVEGVASAEDIDKAMRLGANHPMGPLALADLIGIDICYAIMMSLYRDTCDSKYRPHPRMKRMLDAGLLGRKTKRGFFVYS